MHGQRIRVLDGLRAFAIILVMFYHSAKASEFPIILDIGGIAFQRLFYNGWVGVDLFFVLSGFLISSQLLKMTLTRANLKHFLLRRYFRIAPVFYIILVITLFYNHIFPHLQDKTLQELFTLWWLPTVTHFLFMYDYVGRSPAIEGLFWSIAVEIKFYMLLPLFMGLLALVKGRAKWFWIALVFYGGYFLMRMAGLYMHYGTGVISHDEYFSVIRTPSHMALDGLIVGVLCALWLNQGRKDSETSTTMRLNLLFSVFLFLFFILALFSAGAESFYARNFMTPLFSISFGFLLIALVRGCYASAFFSHGFFGFIAQISYSLYLTHIFAVKAQVILVRKLENSIDSDLVCWLVSMPAYFALSVCMAYILHTLVEQPVIDWSKRKWPSASRLKKG